jgi:phosphoglycolate phosphatase
MIEAVFFDLDGTLADTAADLGGALNRLRAEEGLEKIPLAVLRPHTSHGVRGMLGVGLGILPGHERYAELAQRFLDHYGNAVCAGTVLFPGMDSLLQGLELRGIPWGVVTNKTSRFTLPLLTALGVTERAACIVSGDSAPRPKPHPDPLLLAAELARVAPARCVYVGDDLRDVQAAHAAGMRAVVAAYGYLGEGTRIEEWGGDHLIDRADELLGLLDRLAC